MTENAKDLKVVAALEEQLRKRGIDPAELKKTLLNALREEGHLPSIGDAEIKCVAQMVDAVTPGPFVIVLDNGGHISAIGNESNTQQVMMCLGYAFMFMAEHPEEMPKFKSLIETGLHGNATVKEAFTLGPDH